MKLKFNPNLDYQQEAIESTMALFNDISASGSAYTERGIANDMPLNPEVCLKNLQSIQQKNFIESSASLMDDGDVYPFPNFSIEMETGTGKTYVYLRTIFELNRKYGFTKFIIVVPSIAVKEGEWPILVCSFLVTLSTAAYLGILEPPSSMHPVSKVRQGCGRPLKCPHLKARWFLDYGDYSN